MKWMVSANGKVYDHVSAFDKWGFIDWTQRVNYEVGDIVYIYCARPYKKVMFKTVVEKIELNQSEIVDDREFWVDTNEYESARTGRYARLKLLVKVNNELLSLDYLKENGLKSAPQSPIKVKDDLVEYIEKHMNEFYPENLFAESDVENYLEGEKISISVNKYERSSIARQKCIEHKGLSCLICGFNFEEKYGEIGKGFIHIHHIKPVHLKQERYLINYKDDLIPVCPNCHAMLHKKINGENIDLEDLKEIIKNR